MLKSRMTGLNREKGLEKSDEGALNPEQRSKLRQLKVDVQKLDEKYIRVRTLILLKLLMILITL